MSAGSPAVDKSDAPGTTPGNAPPTLRIVRRLITTVEWFLRLLVLDRKLPGVKARIRDLPYGDDRKHRLDVVVPPGEHPRPLPLLVYVHGGGWVSGDKSNYAWVTGSFARGGLLVFNVNYRWAPEAPFRGQVRDIARAVAWAREHAPEYGGDPDRVFLAGDSAGAHLACWIHVALGQPHLLEAAGLKPPMPVRALAGSLLFYGIYDLAATGRLKGHALRTPLRSLLGARPEEAPALLALASPLRHVAPGQAPLFVCAGEKDILYGQSTSLVEALRKQGAACRSLLLPRRQYPEAGHAFLNFGSRAASGTAMREALAFIRDASR